MLNGTKKSFVGLSLFGLISTDLSAQNIREVDQIFERHENAEGVVYLADQLELKENEKVIFEEDAKVYLKNLKMDRYSALDAQGNDLKIYVEESIESDRGILNVSADSQILDTSGLDGPDGADGKKALDGLRGTHGAHGSDASDGADGVSANSISLITPKLRGDVILLARGGNGGAGGAGGDGGFGGQGLGAADARVLYRFRGMENLGITTLLEIGSAIGVPVVGQVLAVLSLFNGITIGDGFDGFDGGNGGNAGRGGDGGDGGDGGHVELIYAERTDSSRIFVNTRGGVGGAGGAAGLPGRGGRGGEGGKAGDLWGRDGMPGNPGAIGARAGAGQPGAAGKPGKVEVIETGDVEWLRCYIRYRQTLDLTNDQDLAREILGQCLYN